MANPRKRVPENVAGDFFVDSTCIDCDACRQIAPAVFGEAAETSFVKAQPVSSADRRQALRALLACPTVRRCVCLRTRCGRKSCAWSRR